MNLHHIKTDNDNGTKYLETALNNAIKAVENYETDKIILHDIPTSIFGNFKFTGTTSFNGDIVEIKTNKFNLLYGKASCKCVITSLAKSVKQCLTNNYAGIIKQEITITGQNWNDIIKLPCFSSLEKRSYGIVVELENSTLKAWLQLLDLSDKAFRSDSPSASEEFKALFYSKPRFNEACIGDTLIQYQNGLWEVKHKAQ